ncbi:polysaccharide pyruvyl transferase [Halopolyspora algeriensis]|uniref:Polysaccharide pyruvyl transferase n=1 Tax=Halopolyspora algeriensis TaxID=1500506 RepID=A0A368VWU5_9ACTN|nr:polysaccharide pyruvyl transferase family protein [Halopolyspora algeriensis]RCW44627.1 polysaccharide pyruvyl transferase [Halopolyspora algeriensis]TQM55988.1 polysaccharide pyruvyl transferase [Halopolyspora algeriensis]
MRVLITGWPSFLHGEATAGDVAAMERVAAELAAAHVPYDTAWSPGFAPDALSLDEASAQDYTDVVFVCGPAHGEQVRQLHQRYARCRRLAIDVSIVDRGDPAVTGFHTVFARDEPGATPSRDIALGNAASRAPVVGVILAPEQPEYSDRRLHGHVHECLGAWLARLDCAPLPLDTRLDTRDWWLCSTPDQFSALIARTDVVVTSRMHGLVFALRQGIPALAVDPVSGGGKVTAQAQAWDWPAIMPAETLAGGEEAARPQLDRWWSWCLSAEARALADSRSGTGADSSAAALSALVEQLCHAPITSA